MSDISQSSWSETDGSNNQAAPLGAPEGMLPSGVNNTMRAMMGATKRFWNRINGTVAATNLGNAYTYTGITAAPSLVSGEIYTFRCPAANSGAATLNVGVGGAQSIVKHGVSGTVPLASSDFASGAYVMAAWDSISSQFVVLNTPVAGLLTSELASLSTVVQTDLHSISAVINTDLHSVSAVINTNLHSVSAIINADIHSVSAVLTTAFQAIIPHGSNMVFVQNSVPAGWVHLNIDDYALRSTNNAGIGGTGGGSWVISGISAETADHAHFFSATSGNENANHTHNVAGTTGVASAQVGCGNGANGVAINVHTHDFNVNSGGISNVHQHAVSGFTGGVTAGHTHTFDGSWRPQYINVLICSRV